MNYGLPYKGSKNKLAERIVSVLPPKKHFYDLFCGGCAVTHAAMLSHKWDDFTINDLNWQCPTLFVDALNGKYKDDTRWISREDFFRLRDTDPYVAFVWSFGNNLRDYIYSREIEPLKKAIHYALYFGDYSFAKELGHDLSFLDAIKEQDKRYSAVRHYFQQFGRMQLQSHVGGYEPPHYQRIGGGTERRASKPTNGCENWRITVNGTGEPIIGIRSKKKRTRTLLSRTLHPTPTAVTDRFIKSDKNDFRPCRSAYGGGKIHCFTGDYASVHIEPDSVIYCDIPYLGTNIYQKDGFDYERFYEWCFMQSEPVFISSYAMPDNFECVAVFKHTQSLCATKTSTVYEKLFIPKGQTQKCYQTQLSLF